MKIAIRGEGIAAYCCAWQLSSAGHHVTLHRTARTQVPAILLSDTAIALIRDVFQRPEIFAGLPRIERRVVAWGPGSTPQVLPHAAVVVSESQLLTSLWDDLTLSDAAPEDSDFVVVASLPLPPKTEERRFGSRMAFAAEVRLRNEADATSCWIESLEQGWLFLIPQAAAKNWLLAVGSPLELLLQSSRVIGPRIELLNRPSREFDACPRVADPLAGPDWLACGTAAMAFDPICGDGTAHAIREAILAAAVIRASAEGGDPHALKAHYGARLTAGFGRHLQLCREFYRTGGSGKWWDAELTTLDEGIAWCGAKLRQHGDFRYRLDGFDLKPL